MSMNNENYDTLVLPGGGVKGFIILGALQALKDFNFLQNLTKFVGTSIGSAISYLLILGYTPIEIVLTIYKHGWLEKTHNYNLVSLINGEGATSFDFITKILETMTLEKCGKFFTLLTLKEQLNKTLICVTYNMTQCKTEYLSYENYPDLPCLTAIRMSCNIPLIFDRFKYMDSYYIDGGFTDNFPVLHGEKVGEKVLAIQLTIQENSLKDIPEDGIQQYFFRLLQIPIVNFTNYRLELATAKSRIFQFNSGELKTAVKFHVSSKERLDMFSIGYENVKNSCEKI